MSSVVEKGFEEGTYRLKDSKQGDVYLKKEWFNLSKNKENLYQVNRLSMIFISQVNLLEMISL